MEKQTLGQKIKNFRVRSKMSQLDLELEIDASAGSISRIESGKVNPTKETLIKIIEVLKLNAYQTASLYNIKPYSLASLLATTKKLSSTLNLEEVLQHSVNEIVFELDLLASAIFLVKDNKVYAKTFTQTWFTDTMKKLLDKPFDQYMIPLTKDYKENLIVNTILEKKSFYVNDLFEATQFAYSRLLTKLLVRLIKYKSGITFPLVYGDKCIGVVFYCKSNEYSFETEKPILKAFNEHIIGAIVNAEKYNNLAEIIKLKNG